MLKKVRYYSMHLVVVNCSPRPESRSNTAAIANAFASGFAAENNDEKRTTIGFILQGGFEEAHQLRTAERYLEKLPYYFNCDYSRGHNYIRHYRFWGGLAPMYTIFFLLKKYGKIRGVKDFCGRIFRTDNVPKTIIITAVFFLSQVILNIFCNDYLGNPWYLFILYMPLMIFGGGLEEIGWNGFLQPAMEENLPFPIATLISGVIWAVWHLPLWFVQNANQSSMSFISFLCHCIALAFVLATLYKLTESVFACLLMHAWVNVLGGMFTRGTLENPVDIKLLVIYIVEIILSIVIFSLVDKKSKISANVRNVH